MAAINGKDSAKSREPTTRAAEEFVKRLHLADEFAQACQRL
jgi:hypothetical protein